MSNSSRNQDTYQQHVGGWSRILANELSGAHSCGFSAPHPPTAAPPTTHTMQQFIYLTTHWRTNRRDGRNGWLPWICLTASAWITSNKSPATARRRDRKGEALGSGWQQEHEWRISTRTTTTGAAAVTEPGAVVGNAEWKESSNE